MTDDCDSLFSCQRLCDLFEVEIGGFYSFDKGLYLNKEIAGDKEPIYVDLSISNAKCFDNHRTFIKNPEAVNPNEYGSRYNKKYCLGTYALILGLYGGLEDMRHIDKLFALAVDGGFIGYYNKGGIYRSITLYWLQELGLDEILVPLLEKFDMNYFQYLIADYNLMDKVYITNDGTLDTATYSIPVKEGTVFELVLPIRKVFTTKEDAEKRYMRNENIIVSAETFKNQYVLNIA